MSPSKLLSWIFAVVACLAAFLPYGWGKLFNYKFTAQMGETIGVVVYFLSVGACLRLSSGNKKYRWLLVLAPVCLWPMFKTIFTFMVWSLRGMAP
ncbi:MAG: hypothetical protein HYR55_08335 [Acidobacteria bacterium]|nr:hypothetical protein [Acidobacteriota bacterium]